MKQDENEKLQKTMIPRILRLPEALLKLSGLGRSTIYNYIGFGLWTQPIAIGTRAVGWPENEVTAINLSRIAGKSNSEIASLVKKLMEERVDV